MSAWIEYSIDQGADFTSSMILTDDATGLPMNLTNYLVFSNAKNSYDNTQTALSFTCTLPDAANGNLQISLAGTESANVQYGRYYFDTILKAPAPSNTKTRITEGIVTIYPGVS